MDVKETRVDLNKVTPEELEKSLETSRLLHEFNQLFSHSFDAKDILNRLFDYNLDPSSTIMGPLQGVCFDRVHIGRNSFINSNCLMMARGKIEIGDSVLIASNAQLITNDHDFYDRDVLLCKPIIIEDGAWLGAGVTVLPGVRIGKYAAVGASSVVTQDIPDYAVAAGNPAKVIRILESNRFKE